jgi:hypothetical protein
MLFQFGYVLLGLRDCTTFILATPDFQKEDEQDDLVIGGAGFIGNIDFFGDVRDRKALEKALVGVEAIFYEAAVVGVGQFMYEIRRYVKVNTPGAATLLDILAG